MTRPSFDVNCRPAALVGGGAVSDTSRVVESTLFVSFWLFRVYVEMEIYICRDEIDEILYCTLNAF